jgi:cyanate permease
VSRLVPGPDWPFAPARVPLFYGWIVLGVSTLGFLASIPGQTMGMAVFTEPLMAALGLSRTELSLAYMAGTIVSSAFLTRAGRLYDHVGGRVLMVVAALALAATLAYIALLPVLLDLVPSGARGPAALTMILVGYLFVRFFGQGVLTSAARNILLAWFERRRGLVSGIRGVFVSLGFSLAPPALAALIFVFGWQGALLVLAGTCGIGFAALALVLARDAPEPCGLRTDGDAPAGADAAAPAIGGASLDAARRSPVFWIYCLGLAMHAMFGTAITFHVVSVFAGAGRDASEAFGYFLPVALVSTSTNFVASWASDRTPLRPWLVAMLVGFLVACAGLGALATTTGLLLLVLGQGLGGGLWGMISSIAWVRLFGRASLGAISGQATSLTVFFSAVGPAAFAVALDATGSFDAAVLGSALGFTVLLGVALVLPRTPAEQRPPGPRP